MYCKYQPERERSGLNLVENRLLLLHQKKYLSAGISLSSICKKLPYHLLRSLIGNLAIERIKEEGRSQKEIRVQSDGNCDCF
ncbi:MAG: hypothetical protein MUE44_03815 [Oscillatoriaceae cyanobacterium Prado104]|nr:hypothetical protein [Oscillatoriaceae cyanobacterium Prado104]